MYQNTHFVRKVKIEQTSPTTASAFIKMPNAVKHLIQAFGRKTSATAIITEIIIKGKRLSRSERMSILQIKPETKQPIGTVAIPQSKPKKSSLCRSLLTRPSEKGMVKDITQPIIEDTTNAL